MTSKRSTGHCKKASRNIRTIQSGWRQCFEAYPDAVMLVGRDGTIHRLNGAAQRLFPAGRSPMTGKNFCQMLYDRDIQHPHCPLKRALRVKRPFQEKIFVENRGKWFHFFVHPFPAARGNASFIMCVIRDITASKKLQDALQNSRELLEQTQRISAVGGWEYDLTTGAIIWTDEVYRIYGVPRDFDPGDVGRDMTFYAPGSREMLQKAWDQAIHDGIAYDLDLEFINNHGKHLWVRTVGNPVIKNGAVIKIIGNIMDITERKRIEQDMSRAYQQLQQAQEELIRSSKMAAMGQLAAGISHELNQPLTGIKGFAQAALYDVPRDVPVREDLIKILEQTERMNKIINNVNMFAHKADFAIADIEVRRPIEDALSLLSEQLRVRGVNVLCHIPSGLPKARADSDQLLQALINLLTNAQAALEGLQQGAAREISISCGISSGGNEIEISVADSGPGVPRELKDKIFEPFFSTKTNDKALGLGLYLVKQIIESFKGTISLRDSPSGGAEFIISLPVSNK
ncbi:MAG: PAS domain S-box protein [Candidatus Omnitrophica bacterium]|nr:PAS domain S-box protein [Candidatus Omnitrophota bacterium]